MPGAYAADRKAKPGRAGLALPYTPTTGPLTFGQSTSGFQQVPMFDHYFGPAAKVGGLWTDKISDCAVFCAAEWQSNLDSWGNVYFAHVQGGDWMGSAAAKWRGRQLASTRALLSFLESVAPRACYSLLAVPSEYGYSDFAALPGLCGFPPNRLSVYISHTSGGLGLAVEFTTMGEFGEIGSPSPSLNTSTPYGRRIGKGGFDSSNW